MKGSSDQDRILAEMVTHIRFDQLSPHELTVAKAGIFDCLAVMISGSQSPTVKYLMEEVQSWDGRGNGIIVGYEERAPIVWACLLNGTAAHAEHFDDLNPAVTIHPSCTLVPILIAASSMRRLSGQEWIAAYACGFEMGVRLGRAAKPALYSMGFHATTVLGAVMAAATATRLLGFNVAQTSAALGMSASLGSGVRANFGSMTMALHVGHAASQGMLAALLAAKGFSSDPEAVTGRYGFLDCFSGGQYDCTELVQWGKPFELSRSGINFKFYPSGHPTICAIEAALRLRNAYALSPGMIQEIHIFEGPRIRETLNKNRTLQKGKEGKVNLPYCLAVAFHRGNVRESDFHDEMLDDPGITALRSRCHVHVVNDLPDSDEFPARVEVRLTDGRILQEQCDRPSGTAAQPPPWERLKQKFRVQSSPILGSQRTELLLEQLANLERIDDVTPIVKLLSPLVKSARI